MNQKMIEKSLRCRMAKSMFFVLTAILTSLSYIVEVRPVINSASGYWCGIVDGALITISLIAGTLFLSAQKQR